MSSSPDSKIKFRELCNALSRVSKAKGSAKFEELRKFVCHCHKVAIDMKKIQPDTDTSLFPIFRLILPTLDRDRGPYNLRYKSLNSLYLDVFNLKNRGGGKKLAGLRKPPSTVGVKEDFADRMYWLLKDHLKDESSEKTVADINRFLDSVAQSEGSAVRFNLFGTFLREISASELRWLTRILLKEVKIGMNNNKIFEAIGPNAEDHYEMAADLHKLCNTFAPQITVTSSTNDGSTRNVVTGVGIARGPGIQLFSHVRPMLLERLRINDACKLFSGGQNYLLQPKFDGERSQIHFSQGTFKYFTRQGFDITSNTCYGKNANEGFLSPNITPLLNNNCHSIILDGEMMGWHKEDKVFGCKGMSFDVKKLTESSKYQPCFVAYDILLYNDEVLMNRPILERLDYLKRAFVEKEGVLVLSKTTTVSNMDQLIQIFNTALENDDEGIVLKRSNAIYRPNVREKSGCYKIKAEYSDGLVHDLDLIILGGFYGSGRLKGMITSFLVGIASPPTNQNGMPSEFFPLVVVRSGLSDKDIQMIHDRLKPHWKNTKPQQIIALKNDHPHKWISPKDSLILQLRATEITGSQSYSFGFTLRFPRVIQVRLDKSWYDACSTTEFRQLIDKDKGPVQKLTKRKVKAEDIDDVDEEVAPKIRKTVATGPVVVDSCVADKLQEVTRITRLFNNKKVCVLNGSDDFDKNEIVKVLQEHMAKVVLNPGADTFCILVGNPHTLRAKNIISSQKYDVVNLNWLRRATRPENFAKLQDFHPSELYSACSKTKNRLSKIFDKYGDSYIYDTSNETLKPVVEKAGEKIEESERMDDAVMEKMDILLFNKERSPCSVFRSKVGYFIEKRDVKIYHFKFMGGVVSEELNKKVNYIFVNGLDLETCLEQVKKNFSDEVLVLNSHWISECLISERLLPVAEYLIS
ncbi:hypothetical protein QAD02_006869 [Eretmocerus hayati]|uniref:Uncharacterized protein n=1 Tax=Eretmocerus hayati TaxID=131215 RepID=A0ACC2N239_9HYME|nr:hypothetical protein QAD02_006869 [Eretmocerus hayati]